MSEFLDKYQERTQGDAVNGMIDYMNKRPDTLEEAWAMISALRARVCRVDDAVECLDLDSGFQLRREVEDLRAALAAAQGILSRRAEAEEISEIDFSTTDIRCGGFGLFDGGE